jgi:predicted transcriptional regulator
VAVSLGTASPTSSQDGGSEKGRSFSTKIYIDQLFKTKNETVYAHTDLINQPRKNIVKKMDDYLREKFMNPINRDSEDKRNKRRHYKEEIKNVERDLKKKLQNSHKAQAIALAEVALTIRQQTAPNQPFQSSRKYQDLPHVGKINLAKKRHFDYD